MHESRQIIRWEDPPPAQLGPRRRIESRWKPVADALKARPGRWAVVEEVEPGRRSNTGLASRISFGQLKCFTPAGDFEAVSRRVGAVQRTYARYLGDGEERNA